MTKNTVDWASRPDDDNREWTAVDFSESRPASEVLPQFIGQKAMDELLWRGRDAPKNRTEK